MEGRRALAVFFRNAVGTSNVARASNCLSGVQLLFCVGRTVIRSLAGFGFSVWYLPVFCFTPRLKHIINNCHEALSLGEKCVKANYFILNCGFIWDVFVEKQIYTNLVVKQ